MTRIDINPVGTYGAGGTATGTATVAITPWITATAAAENTLHSSQYAAGIEDDEVVRYRIAASAIDGGGWSWSAIPYDPAATGVLEIEHVSR